MRVAIVHDWLYVVGGAERVLREILAIYPEADVFTLFDFLSPADRAKIGAWFVEQEPPFVKPALDGLTRSLAYLRTLKG